MKTPEEMIADLEKRIRELENLVHTPPAIPNQAPWPWPPQVPHPYPWPYAVPCPYVAPYHAPWDMNKVWCQSQAHSGTNPTN